MSEKFEDVLPVFPLEVMRNRRGFVTVKDGDGKPIPYLEGICMADEKEYKGLCKIITAANEGIFARIAERNRRRG